MLSRFGGGGGTADTTLTLFVDLEQDANLVTAVNASPAWASLIKAVGEQIGPFAEWHVELESALPGSQKKRSIIRLPSDQETRGIAKGAIAAALIFILKEAVAWGVGEDIDYLKGPDVPPEVAQVLTVER